MVRKVGNQAMPSRNYKDGGQSNLLGYPRARGADPLWRPVRPYRYRGKHPDRQLILAL